MKAENKKYSSILLLRGGAIGDFILTLPVLAAGRKNFPDAHIEILGYPHIACLALQNHLADAVQPIESPDLAPFFVKNAVLPSKWMSYFSRFDLIISYLFDPEETLQKNIKRCSASRFLSALHRPNETQNLHATEVFLQPLQTLGIHHADSIPRLVVSQPFLDHPPSTIAIHPGSGSEKKNWPETKWAALIDWLGKNVKSSLLLIGGEAENEKLIRLAEKIPFPQQPLAHNLPLPELAKKLSSCAFFLGHDSGITHLAAALGLPGLILWGESNLKIWHPRSDKMKIIHAGKNLPTLPLETVLQKMAPFLTGHFPPEVRLSANVLANAV